MNARTWALCALAWSCVGCQLFERIDATVSPPDQDIGIDEGMAREAPSPDMPAVGARDQGVADIGVPPPDSGPDRDEVMLPADWWDGRWTARRSITLSYDALDEPVEDVPLPVALGDMTAARARTARVVSCEGELLAQHLEAHSSGAVLWVRLPELQPAAAPCLWLYSSEPDAELPDITDSGEVFDDETLGAWHFDEVRRGMPLGFVGSEGLPDLETTAASLLTPAPGLLGGALTFDSAMTRVMAPALTTMSFPQGSFTLEMWIKATFSDVAHDRGIFDDYREDGAYLIVRHWGLGSGVDEPRSEVQVLWRGYETQAGESYPIVNATVQDDAWNYVAVVLEREASSWVGTVVVNDSVSITRVLRDDLWRPRDQAFNLGDGWDGQLDEVRLSKVARPLSWLKLSRQFALQQGVVIGELEQLP